MIIIHDLIWNIYKYAKKKIAKISRNHINVNHTRATIKMAGTRHRSGKREDFLRYLGSGQDPNGFEILFINKKIGKSFS